MIHLEGIDPRETWAYYIASPHNASQRYLYRNCLDGTGEAGQVTPNHLAGTHSYQVSPDFSWAIHTYSTIDSPPITDLITLPGHQVKRVLEDNHELRSKIAPLFEPPSEFFPVDIDDGVSLDGWMIKPKGFDPAKRYPILMHVYGEPAGQTVLDQWAGPQGIFHRLIAVQGYIVASVDKRGTPGPKGRAWRKVIYGTVGVLSSKEQAAALLAQERTRPYIDSNRTAVWGWSGGGSNTLNLMFRYPGVYKVGMSGNQHTWYDWGKESKDTGIIKTCFYYIDLKTLKQMALVTGHQADVPAIDAKLDAIKSTFDSLYGKGEYYMSEDVYAPDDRANAMAVNAGLADGSKWESIYNTVLTQRMNASNFFDRWVFEALCKMGKQEYALLRMYHRYRTMIPCSFTTLWEHYDRWWASRVDAFDAGSSLNHGWNPPALVLSQTIAGVSPETPGWGTYHVLPKEAFLNSIKCVVPSLRGNVTVVLKKAAAEYSLELSSPANTTAIVGIPKNSFTTLNTIQVNGATVWNGSYRGRVTGVTWNGEDADYVKFNVAPGLWNFIGLGRLPLTSPKPLPPPPSNDLALDKKSWTALASGPDGSFLFSGNQIPVDVSAANAIDGDHWTGWRDMTKPQYAGQWFQVDMKREQTFEKIVLDNTWALWDSPDQYTVSVSKDGNNWGKPIATGAGQLGITTITFPEQKARYIRVTQTGMNALYHWSIYEFDVYRQIPY